MATNLTSTTFTSAYNDDYRDSDHYHRVLFNNGRALQARELTQSQTIIQSEISRLASFIVSPGAIFNNAGSLASGPNAFAFTSLKIDALPTGSLALRGTTISDGDLSATVKAVIPAIGGDPDTLIVKMTSGQAGGSTPDANSASPKAYSPGVTLTTTLGNINIQSVADAVGKGSLVQIPKFDTFAAGHLVNVEEQLLVIDKYSATPSVNIGFKVKEEILTSVDNIALYDNSGSTPNLTSPGADRLRITLELVKSTDVLAGDTYFEVYKIVDGKAQLTRTRDKILSQVGEIINDKLYASLGDFIESRTDGEFDLSVTADSADENFLSMVVSGGTAFVKGAKISNEYNLPIRVAKPRNLVSDITTRTSEFTSAKYGNYFLLDSARGFISKMDDVQTINLFDAVNLGGTSIGSAKVRHLDEYNNDFRLHVFDVALNAGKSISNIKSVGSDVKNSGNIKPVQGRYDIIDREQNNLLFNLPQDRVQEISSVTMVIGKVREDTTSGGGVATLSTGSSNTFADVEQWIVQDSGNGNLITDVVIASGGEGSTAATISGLSSTTKVSVLTYENTAATLKTKTLKPSTTTWQSTSVTLSNNEFILPYCDIYEFNKVTDNTTNEDVTYKFKLDNGQRDNYYGPGRGKLVTGVSAPTAVTVEYRYFQHSTPSGVGYFGGKPSYPDVEYQNVPVYKASSGQSYRLTDFIDMRSLKNPADQTFSGGIARIEPLPRNGDNITVGTAKYWNPRIDVVSLGPDGILEYHTGQSSSSPTPPVAIPSENLPLHQIYVNPYTLTPNDTGIFSYDNRGFKMQDLRNLEGRIDRVERLTTLNMTEQSLNQIQVYDPTTGTTLRQTQGLTGEGFTSLAQSDWQDEEYRARVVPQIQTLEPFSYRRSLGLTYDSDLSTNTVIKGGTVWPKYTEEVYFSQTKATSVANVNQFEIAQSIATGVLTPQTDTWTERRLVDKSKTVTSNSALINDKTLKITSNSVIVNN